MKIDSNRNPLATDTTSTAKTTANPSATRPASTTNSVGSVKISETSRSLGTSHAEAPFDAKRVDAIKAAISAGQFKVNPEAVADKIVNSASQLLATS
jgi:negative regulator of flagellin synthesis FlgM